VESKPKQVQKLYRQQVSAAPAIVPTTSTRAAKKQHAQKKVAKEKIAKDTARPVKEKIVNESVLAAYDDIPEIDSMEELAELANTVPELIADPITMAESVTEAASVNTLASVAQGGLAAAIAKTQAALQSSKNH